MELFVLKEVISLKNLGNIRSAVQIYGISVIFSMSHFLKQKKLYICLFDFFEKKSADRFLYFKKVLHLQSQIQEVRQI